jgi:hypothetical protein
MSGEYDGKQVVGIDLHRRRSVIVRMTEAGEAPEVVLEATYGWYWAVDVLQGAGAAVHLPLGQDGVRHLV